MFELQSGAFYQAVTRLTDLASFIAGTTTSEERKLAPEKKVFHEDAKLDEADCGYVKVRLSALRPHLEAIGVNTTLLALDELETKVDIGGASWLNWRAVRDGLEDIGNTLRRELSQRTTIVFEPREQGLYAPPSPPFGQDVAIKFATNGAFEIDEAGKCLALGRATAAVFHLMRLMEAALHAVSKCLGIPDPVKATDRNWAAMLEKIDDEADDRTSKRGGKGWTVPGDKELFASLYVTLDAVRAAWRNTTMHIENKYTPEEAEHIWIAVRAFMKTLAARCDEDGNPRA